MRVDVLSSSEAHSSGKHYINLLWGKPAPSLLPIVQLAAASQAVFSDTETAVTCLEYNELRGHLPLRRELALWLSRFYGAQTTPDHLCITGGASQSLATILQVLADPLVTEAVWMPEPCYYQACRIFEEAGLTGKLRPIPEDKQGVIDLDWLEEKLFECKAKAKANGNDLGAKTKPKDATRRIYPHLIYIVPTFSNPAGTVMSFEARQRLVALARVCDALIISEDVYDFLQWPAENSARAKEPLSQSQLPRLIDVERGMPTLSTDPQRFGHVLSNATFSKVIAPGLRCGWVDASEAMTFALSDAGSTRGGGCPSGIIAPVVAALLQDGFLERHVRDTLIPAYARRRASMIGAIKAHLMPLGVRLGPEGAGHEQSPSQPAVVGGFFLWLRLPSGVKARDVIDRAKEDENLVLLPGTACAIEGKVAADPGKLDGYIRLCFAWSEEEDLVEGVGRLGNVIQGLLQTQQ